MNLRTAENLRWYRQQIDYYLADGNARHAEIMQGHRDRYIAEHTLPAEFIFGLALPDSLEPHQQCRVVVDRNHRLTRKPGSWIM